MYFKSNFVSSTAIGTAIAIQVAVTEKARTIDLQKIIKVFSLNSQVQESLPALNAFKIRYPRGIMQAIETNKQGIANPIGTFMIFKGIRVDVACTGFIKNDP